MDYSDLTLTERAALMFRHLVDPNPTERERILASLPLEAVTLPPARYRDHLHALDDLARTYAVWHWRTHARLYHDLYAGSIEAAQCAEAELIALERALIRVASTYRFDPTDVRKLAGVEPNGYVPRWKGLCPDDMVEQSLVLYFKSIMQTGALDEEVSRTSH
ncbi:hypothetical protein PQR37_10795 [Paraburkholderia nemoris]|uniref:hypothetical protein n=1 Tax=Paraburkholderia nemoris TaxID=2793076 RepID=UPI0038BCD867